VVALAGRLLEAVAALEQAAELFGQKGNTTSLERVRRVARELGSSARHG
jgi:hypothetical protein